MNERAGTGRMEKQAEPVAETPEATGRVSPAAAAQAAAMPVVADDEISLADIIAVLRENRRLIAWCVGVAFLLGLAYALFKTPEYTASAVVQPVEEEAGGVSSLASRFGGLASLAGINLGGGGNKEEYLAVLRSRELAETFIRRYGLAPLLMPDLWDEEAGRWKAEPPVTARIKRRLGGLLAQLSGDAGWRERKGAEPTMGELYDKFDEDVRDVSEDVKSGLVTVSFTYKDPELAAKWVNDYVAMANEEIRARAIREAEAAIAYLSQEADRTSDVQLKNAIFDLIQGQMQRIATAKARAEYAFRVVDKAAAPDDPSAPKRILAVALSLVLGLMVAFFAVFLRENTKPLSSNGGIPARGDSK